MRKYVVLASLVVVAACVLFLGIGTAQAADATTVSVTPSQDVTGTAEVAVPVTVTVPFLDEWMGSGHADASAEAFRHWDEEDPAEIPVECAKCHSSTGYQDYVGADGSEVNKVDAAVAPDTVVDCVACHNSGTIAKTSVIMPSGLELHGLGDESRCMECHQGRESKVSVDKAIADSAVGDDEMSASLGFRNIHYYAAAATKYGTLAKGGYEYDGKTYDGNFAHVEGYETCLGCHNSHTLEVKVEECSTCHEGVAAVEDLKNVRMQGSLVDYDGDGDVEEGVAFEIESLQEALYANIQAYASEVTTASIAYNPVAYPYFFTDTNANGTLEEEEGNFGNRYTAWTPRLLRAAYNYQTSVKDPGAYVHGGKYIIELLYDSIEDLNAAIAAPVDMTAMRRIDAGHFAGSEEAFRHWDAEGEVPGSCAKCHTSGGLPQFIKEGVNVSAHPSNGLMCSTCHNDLQEFTLYEVESVKFPSGAVVSAEDPETNLCLNCHQGRESGKSILRLVGDAGPDDKAEGLRFINPHYFAAGATLYGSEASGMFQYPDKLYAGFNKHSKTNQCADCHDAHELEVSPETCVECHEDVASEEDIFNIKDEQIDYDGDGDAAEGLYYEEQGMLEALSAAIQTYAKDTAGAAIAYSPSAYPYFFLDTNANGTVEPEEATRENGFNAWTPRLLEAAYNYQWASKDPGSFVHNGKYVLQALYDSLENIGADVSAMTRPEAEAE
jgi:hypothetical protein